jgi:hypothetical protein
MIILHALMLQGRADRAGVSLLVAILAINIRHANRATPHVLRLSSLTSLQAKRVSPLHVAAQKGHVRCIQLLLEAGADVNAATTQRESPLYLAAKENQADAIIVLWQGGKLNVDATTTVSHQHPICLPLPTTHRGWSLLLFHSASNS